MKILSIEHVNLRVLTNDIALGKIICLPTDTIYAISSDATNELAIQKIYQVKNRPISKTLSIFVSDINMAQEYIIFSLKQLQFAKKIWPGPITIISQVLNNLKLPSILINNNKVALRVPNNIFIQNICKQLNRPIIATSANISSQIYNNDIIALKRIFSNYVDTLITTPHSARNNNKKPSSIIELTSSGFKVVREGKLTSKQISKVFEKINYKLPKSSRR